MTKLTSSNLQVELFAGSSGLVYHFKRLGVCHVRSVDVRVCGCVGETLCVGMIGPLGLKVVERVWIEQKTEQSQLHPGRLGLA